MSPLNQTAAVPAVEIRLGGTTLNAQIASRVIDVRVQSSLLLPDTALVRISEPTADLIDANPFKIGASLEISAAPAYGQRNGSLSRLFKGEIAALEPEFGRRQCVLAARAYDKSYKLHRQVKSRTFQDVTASDVARKVLSDYPGTDTSIDSTSTVYPFIQQSSESDWDFLNRLAAIEGFEIGLDGDKLRFTEVKESSRASVTLTWHKDLLEFQPRTTSVPHTGEVTVRHQDPKTKRLIEGSSSESAVSPRPGILSSDSRGSSTLVISDRVVESASEATALAESTAKRLSQSYVEGEGTALGNPNLLAGNGVTIEQVGSRFSGDYTVTSATHIYRSDSEYETHFRISAQPVQTLLSSPRLAEPSRFTQNLVIGVVTNNNDPDDMGRVRVKFPSLDGNIEGWWARIATVSSGDQRGLLMLPQPDEEVIVGFEHGDPRRPYVLGSLFNGKEKPGEELAYKDGSYGLKSNEQIFMTSKKDFTMKSDQKMVIEVKQDLNETISGNVKSEVTSDRKLKSMTFTLEADTTATIKTGGSLTVEATGPLTLKGSMIDIEATAAVNVKGAIINLG